MQWKSARFIVIEGEQRRQALIRSAFDGSRVDLEFVPSQAAAWPILNSRIIDVVFLAGPEATGQKLEFGRSLKTLAPATGIVLVADLDPPSMIEALKAGIDECIAGREDRIPDFPAAAERALARRQAEREALSLADAIVRSQKQWMSLLDAITDYIFVIDDERRLVKVNVAFARVTGMQPRNVIGRKLSDLLADASFDFCVEDADGQETPRTCEKAIGEHTYQISVFPLSEEGRRLSIYILKDITELRRLKDRLYHAEKMASLGSLVSGLAHEINNPLTGTIAYTELLSMRTTDESVRRELAKILNSADRCRKIIENLLTFSRQTKPTKSVQSLHDLVDRTIDLRAYTLRKNNIEIVRDFGPDVSLLVDAQQFQHAVLNILINAEQSLAGSSQPVRRITITMRTNRERRRISLRIADNGPGIPDDIFPRIFDPFFTTKPVGAGTGLGLSIAHGIIAEHGGMIAAESVPAGASFLIDLPLDLTSGHP